MNFLSMKDLQKEAVEALIEKALEIKKNPGLSASAMAGKNLLMLFEAPSLRTRLSFEVGMNQMGGSAIYYPLSESTLGKKESAKEFSRVISRYADMVTARVYEHHLLEDMAKNATIPVINAMTNFEHPCQVLSDFLTIWEKKQTFVLKLAYLGDGLNNVTHSLLYGCAIMGIDISIACPKGPAYNPEQFVIEESRKIAEETDSEIEITSDPRQAVRDADIVYTDTWMSYHVPKSQEKRRVKIFSPYQVNEKIMSIADKDAIFMHCLPATRGQEVTDEVIDSKQSVITDQAENRLHMQKALMLRLMKK